MVWPAPSISFTNGCTSASGNRDHHTYRKTNRDFVRPQGPAELFAKKQGKLTKFVLERPPMDVVGWDGFVYPWAFAIEKYQPKTGLVHLPPTIHTTFAGPGFLVCSFVPRVTDRPQAIPCPTRTRASIATRSSSICGATSRVAAAWRRGPFRCICRHCPRAAPRRLRGQHRQQAHRRDGGHGRYVPAANAHRAGGEHRGPRVPRQLADGGA